MRIVLKPCRQSLTSYSPVKAYWVFPPVADAKCLNEGLVDTIIGALNIFVDLLVTCLPIPVVISLRMPLKERLGVIVLLGIGSCAVVAAAAKTYYVYVALIGSWDQTWWTVPIWITAIVEANVIIVSSEASWNLLSLIEC